MNLELLSEADISSSLDSVILALEKKDHIFFTTFLSSYICFSKFDGPSMYYNIFENKNKKQLLFVINTELSFDEVLDLLFVAIDIIIKLVSDGELLKIDRILETYT